MSGGDDQSDLPLPQEESPTWTPRPAVPRRLETDGGDGEEGDGGGVGRSSAAPPRRSLPRRVLRWAMVVVAVAVTALIAVILIRTLGYRSGQPAVPGVPVVLADEQVRAERLAGALRFETVSRESAPVSAAAFRGLHDYVRERFPAVHQALNREVVAEHSLLYTWEGSDPAAPALVLMGHMDVVPAEGIGWKRPPFSGDVAEGFVWGRGALDDKVAVLGILEAVEQLLSDGFQPRQTVYLAFGHDEEIAGEGARTIAALLRERGVEIEAVLDEGLVVTEGVIDGVSRPVGLIGIAEKGFANIELKAHGSGGHASMPPGDPAIDILARALRALDRNPMPASLSGPPRRTFDMVGREMSFGRRLVMANLWLFAPLVRSQLEDSASTNAVIRTTMAPTMLEAGVKANVLPGTARAVVNVRIRPGDGVEDVLVHVRKVIDDRRVDVGLLGEASAPSAVSSTDSRGYEVLERTIRQLDPEIVVAPGLVVGFTDSRHFQGLAADVYRFLPLRLSSADLPRIHGVNERISVENYTEVVWFYMLFLKNMSAK